MKRTFASIVPVILISMCLQLQAQTSNPDITGVYRYLLEESEGMSIVTPTHFIWVITNKDRHHFGNEEQTEEQKVSAFEAQNVAAGTWEYTGKQQVAFTFTHHYNAKRIGQSFTWEYEQEGDLFHIWTLGKDGNRGPLQKSHRVAAWNAQGTCDTFNGVWEYSDGFEGIYIQSGGYGAWIIMPDKPLDLTTAKGKAMAFDELNANFAIGDCSNEMKQFWNVLHSADIRAEKISLGSISMELEPDLYGWELLDKAGRPLGVSWQTRRIAK